MKLLIPRFVTMVLLSVVVAGCTKEARKQRTLNRAEKYFKAGEYEKARIESMNVLRVDPDNAAASRQLGIIWDEQGAVIRAFPFLRKASELSPNDLVIRKRLAAAWLTLGERVQARKEALDILKASPSDDDALLILADASRTEAEIEEASQLVQDIQPPDKAVLHLASAKLFVAKRDLESAERELQRALTVDPNHAAAHMLMGEIFMARKATSEASTEFKAAASHAPVRSVIRVKCAEFLAGSGAMDEATAVLTEINSKAPDYLPAWCTRARIAFAQKQHDESLALLQNVLARDSLNYDALMLQAQVRLAKGEVKKGIEALESLSKIYQKAPLVLLELARAYLRDSNPSQAALTLDQAVKSRPDFLQAVLLQAEVNLRIGEAQRVVSSMQGLLKKYPKLLQAQVLLAEAYRSLGQLDEAADVLRGQVEAYPENAQLQFLLGVLLRQQNKNAEARSVLEKAQELAPDNAQIATQLIELHLANKDFSAAGRVVEQQRSKSPDSAATHFLEGKVLAAQGQWENAEAALLKALDVDPHFSAAYDLLISTYISANKFPEALTRLEGLLAANPKNVSALMLSALIYDKTGEFTKARDAYEKVLAITPDSTPALNNLAYIYAERLNEPDKAYSLAFKARGLQPTDATIADTLGWVLYKRGDYQQALALLHESAQKLPGVPEIQFHLGMAGYMMGQEEAARAALKQAADSPADFPGKEEARRRLALLGDGSAKSTELSINDLESIVTNDPRDLLAQLRLGEACERQGTFEKAAAAYEQAFKTNPKMLQAAVKLAQLYAGPLHEPEKALEFGKAAKRLAPDDPKVAGILGGIAYQSGHYSRARDLLTESAIQLPKDAAVLLNLAWADYYLGKVGEARTTMQRVLDAAPDSRQAGEARTFLSMTASDQNASDVPTVSESEVQQVLKADPNHMPALMAQAAILEHRRESKSAVATYTEVLRRFPDFAPAQKHLASLYVNDPDNLGKAYDLAVKARRTFPDDPELALTLAEISFKRNEFESAIQLYQQSAASKPLPAKSLYLLGMSYLKANKPSQSKEALQQALAAGLTEPLATEARSVLAELANKRN